MGMKSRRQTRALLRPSSILVILALMTRLIKADLVISKVAEKAGNLSQPPFLL